MGLFGKKIKMTYDEALNILMDGTEHTAGLQKLWLRCALPVIGAFIRPGLRA